MKHLGVRIEATLHRRTKIQAAREDRSISDIVADALREYLAKPKEQKKASS